MYTQVLELSNDLLAIEEIVFLDSAEWQRDKMLIPDNRSELLIALSGDIAVKLLGSFREVKLCEGQACFIMPRGRGAVLKLIEAKCLLLKINPIYTKSISRQLKTLANGIFGFEANAEMLGKLKNAGLCNDPYLASDIIDRFCYRDNMVFNETIVGAIEMIRCAKGKISVGEIYTALGISKSKLEQHFNKELGLTPKEFCKIQKLNFFIESYRENQEMSLTELTYLSGYYDQSHLIKDFKYFLDTSPRKFLKAMIEEVAVA